MRLRIISTDGESGGENLTTQIRSTPTGITFTNEAGRKIEIAKRFVWKIELDAEEVHEENG